MEKLTRPTCPSCGGTLLPIHDNTELECNYCMSVYPVAQPKEIDEELAKQLNSADTFRRLRHFDEAGEMYEDIIKKYPDQLLAYWGAFLSEYGIEYVGAENQDERQYHPICHRVSRIRATDSRYLKSLFSLCSTESSRQTYRMKVDQVENIRYRTYEISRSQEPYDVFLCHSGTTHEQQYAKELAAALEAKGKRVYVPEPKMDATTREAYDYNALQSAEYMFVLAESVQSLNDTLNTWSRFSALPNKRLQVIHDGLNETEFPYKLRLIVQSQAPIDLGERDWKSKALDFLVPAKGDKGGLTVVIQRDEDAERKYQEVLRRMDNYEYVANDLTEAFILTLACINVKNLMGAERAVNVQLDKYNPGEIRPIAELCLELFKLTQAKDMPSRQNAIAKVNALANKIRTYYPKLTEKERDLYLHIKRSEHLIYLAKCFNAIKDTDRQCFILDLVDYTDLVDPRLINEFATMLFKNNRQEVAREVLRAMPRLDGDYLLPLFLKEFSLGEQKQTLLMAIGDKFDCTDKVVDELNSYLSTCKDVGIALAVVQIMTRCGLELSVVGLDGALSRIYTESQAKTLLANYGKRSLSGIEVDKLVLIATNGDDVAKEILRHLRYETGIADLGAYNMRTLLGKCHLAAIKTSLFAFKLDRPLAEQLLLEAVRGQGEDRLSVVSALLDYVSAVDLEKCGSFLLGNDPIKEDLAAVLAPKVGKFAGANKIFEQFLRGKDSDETKRKIIALFQDFPYSEKVIETYLEIYPSEYDEQYKKMLFGFIADRPAEARSYFVKHYEKLIDGYEKVLPKMLDFIKFMDDAAVVRFVLDFRGTQECKDTLFLRMADFVEKPKKLEVDANGVTCNLLQAYLFTLRGSAPTTNAVVESLRKKGLKIDDKVVVWGKKHKPSDYVGTAEFKPEVRTLIEKYFK